MTREEQIENAADIAVIETIYSSNRIYNSEEIDWSIYNEAYQKGAKWADAHPNWHKCTNTLPTAKFQRCICTDGRDVFLALWVDCTEEGGLSGWELNGMYNEPTAWMELPKINLI